MVGGWRGWLLLGVAGFLVVGLAVLLGAPHDGAVVVIASTLGTFCCGVAGLRARYRSLS